MYSLPIILFLLFGVVAAFIIFILFKRNTQNILKSLLLTLALSCALTAISIWGIGGWDGMAFGIITFGMIGFTLIYLIAFFIKQVVNNLH